MRILFILLFFLALNLSAQEHPIGFKFGGNVASLAGDDTGNLSSMLNFHAGFFMEIGLTKDLKVQPELLFTVYGFKLDSRNENPNVRLNYIALPIIAKYFISETFSLDVGPQVGLLLSAKNGTGSKADVKSEFYDRDFGINAGASLAITEKVGITARYYFGLSDVTTVNSKNFNRAIQLAFQYKIN